MRVRISAVLVAVAVLSDVAAAQTAGHRAEHRLALRQPVIEGLTLAGLRLGEAEGLVVAMLGPPQASSDSPLAERLLRYELVADIWLEVHVGPGGIQAIGLRVLGDADPALSPQTIRGVVLGMPLARVMERYGDPPNGRYWYAIEGVAFNMKGETDTVVSMLVFPP
ncbi:MAG: hypothetical protein ACREKS_00285, partial [Candidatus Rokuibacteriota bacterium]